MHISHVTPYSLGILSAASLFGFDKQTDWDVLRYYDNTVGAVDCSSYTCCAVFIPTNHSYCPYYNFEDDHLFLCPHGWSCTGGAQVLRQGTSDDIYGDSHDLDLERMGCGVSGLADRSSVFSIGCEDTDGEAVSGVVTLSRRATHIRLRISSGELGADMGSGFFVHDSQTDHVLCEATSATSAESSNEMTTEMTTVSCDVSAKKTFFSLSLPKCRTPTFARCR